MICVPKSPRRLFYKWTTWGVEIEYPSDIPTPTPAITVNSVQVTLPPTVPGWFQFYVSQPAIPGAQPGGNNYLLATFYSFQVPSFYMYPRWWGQQPHCWLRITTWNQWGQSGNYDGRLGVAYTCGSLYMVGGSIQQPRCDLLVGSDRIINPTINTPCPTWRLEGGICPPDTIPCDDECMPCDSLVARIQALMV